ncbi:MAG TPA: tetratricopeptide repeat protein [bacterium]|nr:tetratricopeptide repeat protein [bacterium]
MASLGERIRSRRRALGLTQSQLGGTELTKGFISLVEKGRANPSIDTLRLLARRLATPIGYFLEDSAQLSEDAARVDVRAARVILAQGDVSEAQERFSAALSSAQQRHDAEVELDCRIGLAAALVGLKEFDSAEDQLRRSRELTESAGTEQQLARIECLLGHVEAARGNLSAARDHLLSGYRLLSEHGCPDLSLVGDLLCSLGQAAAASGDRTEASRWFREAVTLLGPIGDLERIGGTHARLGAAARDRTATHVAVGHLARAEHAYEGLAGLRLLAQAQGSLGTMLLEDGHAAEAIVRLEDALRGAERTGDDALRARSFVSLAQALMGTGAFSRAEQALSEAERLTRAKRDGAQAARIELAKAQLLRRTGHPTEALTSYRQAITSFERLGTGPDLARACNELGELLIEQQRPSEAAPYLARALQELNSHRSPPRA